MPLVLEARGLEALKRRLARLSEPDFEGALAAIGQALVEKVEQSFEREADPYGEPWKPLAPSTLEKRRKKGRGAKILQDTGVMRRSLNWQLRGRNAVAVGFSDKKAVWHQEGTERIPARPMLPWKKGPGGVVLPRSWMKEIEDALEALFDGEPA